MKFISSIIILLLLGCFIADDPIKGINIQKNRSDTLYVSYTYWWPSGGPFTGLCGDPYSLVFTGVVAKLCEPEGPYPTGRNVGEVLYTPQKGIIKITEIKFKQPPSEGYSKTPGRNYSGEPYFSSDCFYDLNLKEGDKVIVFIYSYEGEYSIPGKSILKISDFDDPVVISIDKYIKNKQNPLSISSDTAKWREYGLDYALKQIIECRLFVNNKN
jgi:hypothetical protein